MESLPANGEIYECAKAVSNPYAHEGTNNVCGLTLRANNPCALMAVAPVNPKNHNSGRFRQKSVKFL
jgi:hypothetical protein